MFGDDQYENFREDIIPPFCIYGLDDEFDLQPWRDGHKQGNGWGEPADWTFHMRGHRKAAKEFTTTSVTVVSTEAN